MMWYINYFHVQILMIELLFCLHLEKKPHFRLRFAASTALYLVLPFAVPGGFFNSCLVLGGFPLGFWPCVCCPGCCSGAASA